LKKAADYEFYASQQGYDSYTRERYSLGHLFIRVDNSSLWCGHLYKDK